MEVADEMTDLPARFAKLRLLRDTAAANARIAQEDHAALEARAKAGHTVLASEWTQVAERLARRRAARDAYQLAVEVVGADEEGADAAAT